MADPVVGQVCMFGFGFSPKFFAKCDGTLLGISGNAALYSIFGTMYGGDGRVTFGLPDVRGRTPICVGTDPTDTDETYGLPQSGGYESVAMTEAHMAAHNHTLHAIDADAENIAPKADRLFAKPATPFYASQATTLTLSSASVGSAGQGVPHDNMQPYTTINFSIALSGKYPNFQ